MPAKQISINLIGEEEMEHTPIGRIITWAVTYGRYIMIGTEIVVLLAFISRFSLDRKLTDLKEEVAQKEAIIQANIGFEQDFRGIQEQLNHIQTITKQEPIAYEALNTIQSLLPSDVRLESLDIDREKLIADGVADTTSGFSQLVANLQAARIFKNVEVGDVKRSPFTGIEFSFTASMVVPTKARYP